MKPGAAIDRRGVLQAIAALGLSTSLAGGARANEPSAGRLVEYPAMTSAYADPRNVTVWLPAGYDADPARRYPVLYMHDGQNLFDASRANFGVEWGVDEHLTALADQQRVRPAIVVGLWSTSKRFREYAPAGIVKRLPADVRTVVEAGHGGAPLSDGYVRFITSELKPKVDATFRTLPGRADTFVLGSSMGGLISLYALCQYPAIFGGAGCMSTHWPLVAIDFDRGPKSPTQWQSGLIAGITRYLKAALPRAGSHRLYFDHGSLHLDQFYAPYQEAVDRVVAAKGYIADRDAVSRVFPGESHNEAAWSRRLDLPLTFLLTGQVR